MTRLQSEGETLQSDIEKGKALLKEQHAPVFMQTAVHDLEAQYRETAQRANERYQTLKVRNLSQILCFPNVSQIVYCGKVS